ncbi:MAG: DUF1697 domain-containing protein [Actinobacteria bacterium]|nr:DUF1697 domain-containing protein [Actinomycetota bacterium]MCA1721698.1 DUF1697 domain-containing protein [Actinomycetota bacterium]
MSTWALLLRAVNLGPRNRLPMADLRSVLTDLGYGEVKTYLNSGNATFTSSRTPEAADVEQGLRDRLGLDVRATLRTRPQLQAALDALPQDIAAMSYVLIAFLFDTPISDLGDWHPDRVVLGDGVAYLGYTGPMHASKLQNAALEKRLGVASTARTPATVRKLLG